MSLDFAAVLTKMVEVRASDVHLTAGFPPALRVRGRIVPMDDYPQLGPQDTREIVYSILNDSQRKRFENQQQLDFAYAIPGVARFRVNTFFQRGAISAAFRHIPAEIQSLESLGLPAVLEEFTRKPRGLVLVTGPTGSGKSTTLASMVDSINAEREEHILTIEDPIEFLHSHRKCIVNQREIGADALDFATALKAALREDPDVILVGEMRDLETISTALTAAETGHLVFATLHTQSTAQTVDRIIDVFPPHQQHQVRMQLSIALQGIVTQQLLPTADGSARVCACEVLVPTPAIRNLIREGKTHQIYSALQTAGSVGMQTMDAHLAQLVRGGKVSRALAEQRASVPEELKRLLTGVGMPTNGRSTVEAISMSTFAFRAVDLAGVAARGEMDASSKSVVSDQLRQRGLIVLDISEKRESLKVESILQRFKSVNLRALAVFSRQFATLVASGMPMLRCLYTLEQQTQDEMLRNAIIAVRENVESGSSIAQAMESQPGVFDPLYRSVVKAGEDSGRLEEALDRIASQLERLDALRRQVKSAMMYPAVVFTLALVVMIVVVAVIVPVFVGIFNQLALSNPEVGTSLPIMTQITVSVSDFVTHQWYLLLGGIALGSYAFIRWKKSDRGRLQWDHFKIRIPRIGDVVQKIALARWSRTFAGMVASGVPILQAIEISGETAGNAVINEAMGEVYASVKRGGSLAGPMATHAIFPPMVEHMVSVGEESGQLETMLAKIADFYEAEVDARIKSLTALIEPLMIIFVGGVVGFIVISMYLPIFSIYDKVR